MISTKYSDDSSKNLKVQWKKSSASTNALNCVEFAVTNDGTILLRDTKNRDAGILYFNEEEWVAFINGVKKSEFDL